MVGFIEMAVELGFIGWIGYVSRHEEVGFGVWRLPVGIILSHQSQGCSIESANGYHGRGIWKASFGPRTFIWLRMSEFNTNT